VGDHAVDERLGELPHSRRGRTKLPEFLHLLGRSVAMEITPEMKLDGGLPG
jgi:hypothetical protein